MVRHPQKWGLLLILFSDLTLSAQTYTGNGGLILDDGSHNFYSCLVSGVVPNVMDTSYGLETVCINLTHTWDDDLTIWLMAPDGTEFELTSHNGSDGDNYTNTCFNNDAVTPIYQGSAPFTGTFRSEGFMSMINNGQDPNGEWKLHILDTWAWADAGEVLDWSVTFGDDPAVPFPFSLARLPLVVVTTPGVAIPDEPKIQAWMKVINNPDHLNHPIDTTAVYEGRIGIELRGASSLSMPKKSYTLEARDENGGSQDVSLLGMPANDDWVLIGNYADKSLLRNYYSYRLFRKMGHWAPRMEFCELMIDGEYQGIFLLGEKIKRGADRVPIHALLPQDTLGTALTGGYIFKLDWEDPGDVGWYSDYPAVNNNNPLKYLIEYPKSENVKPAQINYIHAYVDSLEHVMNSISYADTLNGYRKFIDENSFIDYIILGEYTKNLDFYRLSTFFHKDREGKIKAGPPWDYDLAWGNGDFMEAYLPSGWNYIVQQEYSDQCPFWWQKFFDDGLFQDRLQCRWLELREDILAPSTVKAELDSLKDVLSVSTGINFTKWPILGVYVWPNPAPIPDTYEGEIGKLKDWVDLRTTWLDNHWTGVCTANDIAENEAAQGAGLEIIPNPNNGSFHGHIPVNGKDGRLEITDIRGNLLYRERVKEQEFNLSLPLVPGIYLIRYADESRVFNKKFMVVR